MPGAEVNTFYFADDGSIPNHPDLPVLLYRGVCRDKPAAMTALFESNGWTNSWVNGVFPYHHYHSNTHEALGILRGSAVLQLGGPHGKTVEVQQGDVLVLPAGTGHKRISARTDFRVLGAYPGGMDYNLKLGAPEDRPQVLVDISSVPLPDTDPIYGQHGPLLSAWRSLYADKAKASSTTET